MKQLERLFKALGDANRLRILKMLEQQTLCHCEVQEVLGLAASTVSKHLGLLKDAGLILDERRGKWVYYRLAQSPGLAELQALHQLLSQWGQTDAQVQADRQKVKALQAATPCIEPGKS